MCGRFTHLYKWKQIHALLSLTSPRPPAELRERYNVAPTQLAPVAIATPEAGRSLEMLRWGLVPRWAESLAVGSRMINARAETVRTKPAFRDAFARRRCLVPVSGFYEWQKFEGQTRKQAWYIRPNSDLVLCFAGLWERWNSPEGEEVRSFTVVTTTPNERMAPIHDRMPVILAPEHFETWLRAPAEEGDRLEALLTPCAPGMIETVRVGTWVNSPAHDDPACVEPVAELF